MPTPHIEAHEGQIADTILLPGDPLRAKYIAENFLEEVTLFNDVRNMLGYTGFYNGKKVSVMGTGMGMPSMGIYAYELITYFGVKKLIRVGSTGSIQPHIKVKDIVLAQATSTNSSFGKQFGLRGDIAGVADYGLLSTAARLASEKNILTHVGNILSSDVFYDADVDDWKRWSKLGVLSLEMEAHALYLIAMSTGVAALAMCTVSDSLVTGEAMNSDDREQSFNNMITLALQTAVS